MEIRARRRRLDAVNAFALCNLSLLAYSGWNDIQRFLEKWDFSNAQLLSEGETQGFVARRDDSVFVSFRGTEPLRLAQWAADVSYAPSSVLPNLPGLVHGGFGALFDNVRDSMRTAVDVISGGQATRLFVTGHSMGGAGRARGGRLRVRFAEKEPRDGSIHLRPTSSRRSSILCGLRCRTKKRYVSIRQRPGHRSAPAAGSIAGDSDSQRAAFGF